MGQLRSGEVVGVKPVAWMGRAKDRVPVWLERFPSVRAIGCGLLVVDAGLDLLGLASFTINLAEGLGVHRSSLGVGLTDRVEWRAHRHAFSLVSSSWSSPQLRFTCASGSEQCAVRPVRPS
ncbi:hypothetical protein DEI83_13715 [Curtobacterium sp. MCBD17_021]|nr:hypothetical protein DEI83_13715 [Curtobacterium sp. MCBD17_021]